MQSKFVTIIFVLGLASFAHSKATKKYPNSTQQLGIELAEDEEEEYCSFLSGVCGDTPQG